mmetsp:Transcript_714/g.2544  ORF Transcript_714/g.2544 Transcript_714/m.2544 type:complete len:426 (+) Transcript_714:471-1748(+)
MRALLQHERVNAIARICGKCVGCRWRNVACREQRLHDLKAILDSDELAHVRQLLASSAQQEGVSDLALVRIGHTVERRVAVRGGEEAVVERLLRNGEVGWVERARHEVDRHARAQVGKHQIHVLDQRRVLRLLLRRTKVSAPPLKRHVVVADRLADARNAVSCDDDADDPLLQLLLLQRRAGMSLEKVEHELPLQVPGALQARHEGNVAAGALQERRPSQLRGQRLLRRGPRRAVAEHRHRAVLQHPAQHRNHLAVQQLVLVQPLRPPRARAGGCCVVGHQLDAPSLVLEADHVLVADVGLARRRSDNGPLLRVHLEDSGQERVVLVDGSHDDGRRSHLQVKHVLQHVGLVAAAVDDHLPACPVRLRLLCHGAPQLGDARLVYVEVLAGKVPAPDAVRVVLPLVRRFVPLQQLAGAAHRLGPRLR